MSKEDFFMKCDIQSLANIFGKSSQSIMLIEEMAELTKALTKILRVENDYQPVSKQSDTNELLENLCEEIADVEIMIEQIKYLYEIDNKYIKKIKKKKIERTFELLKEV